MIMAKRKPTAPVPPTSGEWHALRHGIEIQGDYGMHEIMTTVGEVHGVLIAQVPLSGDFGMMEPDDQGGSREYANYVISEAESLANLRLLASAQRMFELIERLHPRLAKHISEYEELSSAVDDVVSYVLHGKEPS